MPDSVIRVKLKPYSLDFNPIEPENGTVFIKTEGLSFPLSVRSKFFDDTIFSSASNLKAEQGKRYTLSVSLPGYPKEITSEILFQHFSSALHLRTSENFASAFNSKGEIETFTRITVLLSSSGEDSYYLVTFFIVINGIGYETVINWGGGTFNTNLPLNPAFVTEFTESNGVQTAPTPHPYRVFAFTNGHFKNRTFELNLETKSRLNAGPDYLTIYEINKAYFDFLVQANLTDRNSMFPDAEPVFIPGNLSNAIGIFGFAVPLVDVPLSQKGGRFLLGMKSLSKQPLVNH
jgi:hypothetical protein